MAQKLYLEDDRNKISKIIVTAMEVAVIITLGLFIANYIFFSVNHESKSMEPTISQGSVVFLNKATYAFREPQRFDVVAFYRDVERTTDELLIRRIIALPGETVRIEKGIVYINDEPFDLTDYAGEITSDGIAKTEIRLDTNEYFMLGDTPANSEDSRSSTIGIVKKSQIVGRAWLQATSITQYKTIR